MRLFDHVDYATVEKREFQLTILSLVSIVILGAGLAILMYPNVTTHPVFFSTATTRILFFGFCGLCLLLFGYLLDRQIVVRKLRREIMQAQAQYSELHGQAGRDLLETLAGMNHFQDQLMMEFKRAAASSDGLSVLVVRLTPAPSLTSPLDINGALGDAAKTMSRKLKKEDSLYHFSAGAFGILLPGVKVPDARLLAARLSDGLNDAAGAVNRFTSDIKLFNYPQNAATARELETAVLSLLPEDASAVPAGEDSVADDAHQHS
jgi:GGDEF domain-containing protein